jgi:hypothetical protein
MSLSAFRPDGTVPPGDYRLTITALRSSMLVLGPGEPRLFPYWDSVWRARLVDNLEILVRQLWQLGITEIYIDGSFVEDKDHPNDIDGYFVCDPHRFASGELQAQLNQIDPEKCWTWDPHARRPYRGYPKRQLPMWHAYRVELYPHSAGVIAGRDEHGQPLEFPAFFRKCRRTGAPKGIVQVVRGG